MSGQTVEPGQQRSPVSRRRRSRQDSSRGPLHTAYPRPRPGRTSETCELDLDAYLETHPEDTWVGQVGDEAMRAAGIRRGDFVLVDLQAPAVSGDLVAGRAEGRLIVRELRLSPCPMLLSRSHDYPPIILAEHPALDIIGPITALLRIWY